MKSIKLKLNKMGASGMGSLLVPKQIIDEEHLSFGNDYYIVIEKSEILDNQYIEQPIKENSDAVQLTKQEYDNIRKILQYLVVDMKRLKTMHKMKDILPEEIPQTNMNQTIVPQNNNANYNEMTFGQWLMWKPNRKPKTNPAPTSAPTPAPIVEKSFKSNKEAEAYAKENYYDISL